MTDIHITLQWTEGEGEIYATLNFLLLFRSCDFTNKYEKQDYSVTLKNRSSKLEVMNEKV